MRNDASLSMGGGRRRSSPEDDGVCERAEDSYQRFRFHEQGSKYILALYRLRVSTPLRCLKRWQDG